YYYSAKKQNLKSRAAFKILEIQTKFSLMKEGDHILEVGSSPGGWTQIIRSVTRKPVIAVDPEEMEPMDGVIFIRSRIEDSRALSKIRSAMDSVGVKLFDGILSDAMVHTSGKRDIDHASSYLICRTVMRLAFDLLSPGGYILLKQFQGDLTNQFLREWSGYFDFSKITSVSATREASREVYIIFRGFRPQLRGSQGVQGIG
ncbi:MAG TPA: RlmE family RNA methyltransferase, partial [Thermoplasmataceae archaeon]|nr:RlmE family RNA methyltransferase [Thermoplasmataceae archaeon]